MANTSRKQIGNTALQLNSPSDFTEHSIRLVKPANILKLIENNNHFLLLRDFPNQIKKTVKPRRQQFFSLSYL